jgi:prophage DNA circulation protein
MSIKKQLAKATFRGFEFDFIETGKTQGHKAVLHTFPNSNKTVSEDLGRSTPIITMRIVISTFLERDLVVIDTSDEANIFGADIVNLKKTFEIKPRNESYFHKRDNMEQVLDKKGIGNLIHPTRGILKAQVISYTMSESIAELGVTFYDVEFAIVQKKEFLPINTSISSYTIGKSEQINDRAKKKADNTIFGKLKAGYDYVKGKTQELVTAIETEAAALMAQIQIESGLDIAAEIKSAEELAAEIEADAAAFSNVIKEAQRIGSDINGIIQGGWGSAIESLLGDVGTAINNSLDAYSFFSGLFNFGDSDADIPATTAELVEAKKNQDSIRTAMQTFALTYAINSATEIEYTTDEELNEIADQINAQYDKVFALPDMDISTFNILQDQKTAFAKFVDDQTLQVLKVTEVEVVNESLLTLAYKYYGNQDNVQLLQDLNSFDNPSLINGTVKIAVG